MARGGRPLKRTLVWARGNRFPRSLWICLGLLLLVAAAYAPALRNDFVNYDDPRYLTENREIRGGLSWKNVRWAFTATRGANWHPLTWLSHEADVSLFGLDPRGHHGMGAALHAANTLLLFTLLVRMTGAVWPCAFVAGMFGVHPLHVESVAWAAERKDLLSTLFGFLSVAGYLAWVRRPAPARRLAAIALFAVGLLAKPMLVTLPFLLLLLDAWPLGRLRHPSGAGDDLRRRALALAREKLPFFLLAAVAAALAVAVQRREGALTPFASYPLPLRLGNALTAYLSYVRKSLWPTDLAVFYPHPGFAIGWAAPLAAGLLLAAATLLALRLAPRRPWLAVGWLWFLGTLVPVIGIVQVGAQAMADRYSYVPLVGLALALAWELRRAGRALPVIRAGAAVAGAAVLLAAVALTRSQVGVWRTSATLFRHALAVTPDNAVARLNLAAALNAEGRAGEAAAHCREAVRLDATDPATLSTCGLILAGVDDLGEAERLYRRALELKPDYAPARNNLGALLNDLDRPGEGAAELERAIALEPDFEQAYNNLGNALLKLGRSEEALGRFRESVRIAPDNPKAHFNLGNLLRGIGRGEEAAAEYREALRLNPRFAEAWNNLGTLLAGRDHPAAVAAFRRAVEIDPDSRVFRNNLALAERGAGGR